MAPALLRREISLLLGAALRLPKPRVETLRFFREDGVRPSFDGAPVSQYDNLVGADDRREAVRDDERRAAFGSLRQALLDRALSERYRATSMDSVLYGFRQIAMASYVARNS